MHRRLTKSLITAARQCARRAYFDANEPGLAVHESVDADRLSQGRAVEAIAHEHLPGAVLIGHRRTPMFAVTDTREALASGRVVLEGALYDGTTLVRADVLAPLADGYHLIEIKGAKSAKAAHVEDLAIQYAVARRAGVAVTQVSVWHLNPDFVLPDNGALDGVIAATNVTALVRERVAQVDTWVASTREAVEGRAAYPQPGRQCRRPHPCPYQHHCCAGVGDHPVGVYTREAATVNALIETGVQDATEVGAEAFNDPRNQRIATALAENRPVVSAQGRARLTGLGYPRYYLDFESIQYAIPVWAGMSPWEQVPFQFSVHREARDGSVTHTDFLDVSGANPLRALAEALIEAVGTEGPIPVYSAFEKTMLNKLAAHLPDRAADLVAIKARLVDLLPVLREHYYAPGLKASWSIKAVLPTIDPAIGYDQLDGVADGVAAQCAYVDAVNADDAQERERIAAELRAYCAVDTLGLLRVVRDLPRVAAPVFAEAA